MKVLTLLLKSYTIALVSYAPFELSRLIIQFTDVYGNEGLWGAFGAELLIIWAGWALTFWAVWKA